jgi:hypothetical protein
MLKRHAVFPFLFLFYIILSPLLNNLDQIDSSQVARPLAILFGLTALGMAVLRARTKDGHYAGWVVFLTLAFFFVYAHLGRVVQDRFPDLPEWAPILALAAWGVFLANLGRRRIWLRIGGAILITPLANLAISAALLGQLASHAGEIRQEWLKPLSKVFAYDPGEEAALPTPDINPAGLPLTGNTFPPDCPVVDGENGVSKLPDIYYIILDAYGRADVLERLYGVDNAPFLASLERKGFYIARESHTNYIQTALSIPAALNSTYLQPEPEGVSGAAYFSHLIAQNGLFRLLKECGYRTLAFKTGFFFTNHLDVDVTLTSGTKLNEFESLLLAGTPMDLLAGGLYSYPPELSYPAHRRRVLYAFDQLQKLPWEPGPKIVFAHIVSPHPPFVFDAEGQAQDPARSYSLEDGDEFAGSWEEYRRGYAAQVQFVNQKLEKTIDAILARSAQPPVILLQGDHGPGGSLDWSSLENSCLWERTSILNAYYLPNAEADQLYPSISPANTFRIVLNAYFGTGLELLPDHTFYSSHRLPREITDITSQRESMENCPR